MFQRFTETVREGKASPIGFRDIETVTLTTFGILESLQRRETVDI
jgi:hypothetical protein